MIMRRQRASQLLGMPVDALNDRLLTLGVRMNLPIMTPQGLKILMPKAGMDLLLDALRRVRIIRLYNDNYLGYHKYPHSLPLGISFTWSRAALRFHLMNIAIGPPVQSNGQQKRQCADARLWDMYDHAERRIVAEYSGDGGRIQRIILGDSENWPPHFRLD